MDLDTLLENLPGYSSISQEMKDAALSGALIPDASGVWPGEPGYIPTHDVYFAAIGLVLYLQAQPRVTNSSSEGTSVTVSTPDWSALVRYYRSMSPISRLTWHVLNQVEIPDPPHVVKMDMSGRGSLGDIDTDLG